MVSSLLTGCTPEWQCYFRKKMEIDAVYRPRLRQLQAQYISHNMSADTFRRKATALENEWNSRLEYEQKKCFGQLPKKKSKSSKSTAKTTPAPKVPESSGRDPIRLQSYKGSSEEVVPSTP